MEMQPVHCILSRSAQLRIWLVGSGPNAEKNELVGAARFELATPAPKADLGMRRNLPLFNGNGIREMQPARWSLLSVDESEGFGILIFTYSGTMGVP
jgi:hypothetical protein